VLVAAELARGIDIGRWATVSVLAVAVAASLANVSRLKDAAHGLDGIAQQQRGGLAALELAQDTVSPGLSLTQENSGVDYLGLLDAGSYLSAVDAFGSPAYRAAELPTAPEAGQVSADRVSALALRVGLAPASGDAGTDCVTVHPELRPAVISVPPSGVLLTAQAGDVAVALHRFASESFPVSLGTLPRQKQTALRIRADRSRQPWAVQLSGGGPVIACRAAG